MSLTLSPMRRRHAIQIILGLIGTTLVEVVGIGWSRNKASAATRVTTTTHPTTTTTISIPRPVWPQVARVSDVPIGGWLKFAVLNPSKYASGQLTCPNSFNAAGYCTGSGILYRASATSWKAFSSTCTHVGADLVSWSQTQGTGSIITCPSHGSQFSLVNGSPVHSPARLPLPSMKVEARTDGYVYWTGDN